MAIEKICKNCGLPFHVRAYRSTTAFYCSYRCSAQYKMKNRYADKQILIEKACGFCNKTFLVPNKGYKKKTCSKECQNKLQGEHLQQYPKSHPRSPEKLLPPIIKTCVVCGIDFELSRKRSRRQQTCGSKCGGILCASKRKFNISAEEFQIAVNESNNTYDLCDKLKCSLYTVLRLSKSLNIPYKKKIEKLRRDGYYNYTSKNNHRVLYEETYNIKLIPRQGIHHIDGDKINNEINNLVLTNGVSEHSKIHGSLQRMAFELFKDGLIGFNRLTNEYYKKK